MDFGWGWLGKGKNKEEAQSDEDKNPKHRRRSWSEIDRGSLVKGDENSSSNPNSGSCYHHEINHCGYYLLR